MFIQVLVTVQDTVLQNFRAIADIKFYSLNSECILYILDLIHCVHLRALRVKSEKTQQQKPVTASENNTNLKFDVTKSLEFYIHLLLFGAHTYVPYGFILWNILSMREKKKRREKNDE